jgi:hypothetical protein
MAELYKSAVALRFSGDDLDPDQISVALLVQPDRGVRKGGIWQTPKGTPIVARTGMWHRMTAERQPGALDEYIAELLALMTSDLSVWNDLASRYHGHIFAGLFLATFNEGANVSAKTLYALGSRGLSLDLDIYNLIDDQDFPSLESS